MPGDQLVLSTLLTAVEGAAGPLLALCTTPSREALIAAWPHLTLLGGWALQSGAATATAQWLVAAASSLCSISLREVVALIDWEFGIRVLLTSYSLIDLSCTCASAPLPVLPPQPPPRPPIDLNENWPVANNGEWAELRAALGPVGVLALRLLARLLRILLLTLTVYAVLYVFRWMGM